METDVNLNPNTIQYASAAQITRPSGPQTGATQPNRVVQLDGAHDTSDEDDDEDEYRDNDDDHEDNDDEVNDDDNDGQGEDEVLSFALNVLILFKMLIVFMFRNLSILKMM